MSETYTEPDSEFPQWRRVYAAESYEGITHGLWFGDSYRLRRLHQLVLWFWRRRRCPYGIHAFDEVGGSEHYLVCDACQLTVHIARIEYTTQ